MIFLKHLAVAQDLPILQKSISEAYDKGTRSISGKPGVNYWQNKVNYDIDVHVFPKEKKIEGVEKVTYFNNSPDTLKEIWIHLYADFYKKGNARDETIALENITDGVILNSIKVSGKAIVLENSSVQRNATNLVLKLEKPLLSKDSVQIEIGWTEYIPTIYHNRIGAYDSTTSFIGYWYPQVAVYDDIDGWDTHDYGGIQEFYRAFSDYKVKITLPESYYVWATGDLQNPEQVYSTKTMKLWKKSKASDTTICILAGEKDYPKNNDRKKTWFFYATNVGDFAFGISDYFRWEATSLKLEGIPDRVLVNTIFDPKDSLQLNSITCKQRQMLSYYSHKSPNVNYPYSHFTTFVGCPIFDGMEFPMMANNGVFKGETKLSQYKNDDITAHEMAHSYFPMYVGINERKYTWMEEGWAMFLTLEMLIGDKNSPLQNKNKVRVQELIRRFNTVAATQFDAPMLTSSILLRNKTTHSFLSYTKAYWAYRVLQDMLGKVLFEKCLKVYIENWAEKHPTPYDFFFTFNNVSGQNLYWFWEAWFQTVDYIDLSLSKAENGLKVENIGGLPIPFVLEFIYISGQKAIKEYRADVWKEDSKELRIDIEEQKGLKSIKIKREIWPDENPHNNILHW